MINLIFCLAMFFLVPLFLLPCFVLVAMSLRGITPAYQKHMPAGVVYGQARHSASLAASIGCGVPAYSSDG